jgi:NADH-quinone oxidoreductase subunit N
VTAGNLVSLGPYLVLALAAVAVMLVIAFRRSHGWTAGLTLAGLALSFLALLPAAAQDSPQVTPLLAVDGFALFFAGLLLAAAFAVTALAYDYFERRRIRREEFYLLLLLSTLGGILLPASVHFAALILSLELLTVPLYALGAYLRTDAEGIEAGVKYLVLGSATSAFLFFGAALLYAESGTLVLGGLRPGDASASAGGHPALAAAGLALILVAVGFKLALVPFHLWAPDIYQGAPAPVAGYLATVSKGAVFALLIRIFSRYAIAAEPGVFAVLAAAAAASMFAGNWLALRQDNVKRLLAYSSIAHFGYLLTALLAAGDRTVTAAGVYLAAYFVAILAAFGAIGVLSDGGRDAQRIEDFRGLFWRRPWLAAVLTAAFLSLIGIPVTAGFFGKAYVLLASVRSAVGVLALILVVTSAIGLYYYLRVILAMARAPEEAPAPAARTGGRLAGAALAGLAAGIFGLGVYPAPLLDLIGRTAAALRLF